MALSPPYIWTGTTFPSYSDGTPALITQEEFEDCCCQCSCCYGPGGNQQIIIDSDGTGCCDADVIEADNAFNTNCNEFASRCQWWWDNVALPGDLQFFLNWVKAESKWRAYIKNVCPGLGSVRVYGGDPTNPDEQYGQDVTGYVSCDTGTVKLAGTFTLNGSISGTSNCTAFTAEVTLNP